MTNSINNSIAHVFCAHVTIPTAAVNAAASNIVTSAVTLTTEGHVVRFCTPGASI